MSRLTFDICVSLDGFVTGVRLEPMRESPPVIHLANRALR